MLLVPPELEVPPVEAVESPKRLASIDFRALVRAVPSVALRLPEETSSPMALATGLSPMALATGFLPEGGGGRWVEKSWAAVELEIVLMDRLVNVRGTGRARPRVQFE
ncbi:MAG TPA: hypothetical protein VGN94_01580 [Methylobacterium sp.]|nr:hypothetical protein [Methylobacterium sp.]